MVLFAMVPIVWFVLATLVCSVRDDERDGRADACYVIIGRTGKVSHAFQNLISQSIQKYQVLSIRGAHEEEDVSSILEGDLSNCTTGDRVVVVNGAGLASYNGAPENVLLTGTELTNVNVKLPFMLAKICRAKGWNLVHLSTTYTFNGALPLKGMGNTRTIKQLADETWWNSYSLSSQGGVHPTTDEIVFSPSGRGVSAYMDRYYKSNTLCDTDFDAFMNKLVEDRNGDSAPAYLRTQAYPLSKLWSEYAVQYWSLCSTGDAEPALKPFTFTNLRLPTMVGGGMQNHPLNLNGLGYSAKYVRQAIDMIKTGEVIPGFGICWKHKARNMLTYEDAAKILFNMIQLQTNAAEGPAEGPAGPPSMWSGVAAGTWANSDAEYAWALVKGISELLPEGSEEAENAGTVMTALEALDKESNTNCDFKNQNGETANTVAQPAYYFNAEPGDTKTQIAVWAETTLREMCQMTLEQAEKMVENNDAAKKEWSQNKEYFEWMKKMTSG